MTGVSSDHPTDLSTHVDNGVQKVAQSLETPDECSADTDEFVTGISVLVLLTNVVDQRPGFQIGLEKIADGIRFLALEKPLAGLALQPHRLAGSRRQERLQRFSVDERIYRFGSLCDYVAIGRYHRCHVVTSLARYDLWK